MEKRDFCFYQEEINFYIDYKGVEFLIIGKSAYLKMGYCRKCRQPVYCRQIFEISKIINTEQEDKKYKRKSSLVWALKNKANKILYKEELVLLCWECLDVFYERTEKPRQIYKDKLSLLSEDDSFRKHL